MPETIASQASSFVVAGRLAGAELHGQEDGGIEGEVADRALRGAGDRDEADGRGRGPGSSVTGQDAGRRGAAGRAAGEGGGAGLAGRR